MSKLKSFLLFLLSLFYISSCNSDVESFTQEKSDASNATYLVITRANINASKEESLLRNLHLLAFGSNSKELAVYQSIYFKENISLSEQLLKNPIELVPGVYDFYFLTNAPEGFEKMAKGIRTLAELENLRMLHTKWHPSSLKNKGILMTDVHREIDVTKGGTRNAPLSFSELRNGRNIDLERSLAKVTIDLKGSGVTDICEVKKTSSAMGSKEDGLLLLNAVDANHPFRRRDRIPQYNILQAKENQYLTFEGRGWEQKQTLYIPEHIYERNPEWESGSNEITYIQIQLKDGMMYEIPIVSNYNEDWAGITYFEFVRGYKKGPHGETPDFNVYRNQHYKYALHLDRSDISLSLKVLPWTQLESEFTAYDEFDYEEPTLVIDDIDFYDDYIMQIQPGEWTKPISFWLKYPETAQWSATLSNAKNFRFVSVSQGKASANDIEGRQEVIVTSASVSPFENQQFTELYFTINQREVPLKVKLKSGREKIFYGKGNRLIIQLIY